MAKPFPSPLLIPLAFLIAGATAPPAVAQAGGSWDTLHHFLADPANESMGISLSGGADVDGDGVPDVLIGDPEAISNGPGSGSAIIRSGVDGSLLWSATGAGAGDALGWSVDMLGDVDGDGFNDWGVTDRYDAHVFLGPNGVLASSIHAKYGQIELLGDLDGDSRNDFAVANEFGLNDRGSVVVFSGATLAVLLRFDGAEIGMHLGRAVAGPGDVDGDGVPDVMASAPEHDAAGGAMPRAGRVFVWSGADGSLIRVHDGNQAGRYLGAALTGVGDLDGDGAAEYAVGAGDKTQNDDGRVYAYDGATGARLVVLVPPEGITAFGSTLAGPGDLNGDGVPDIVVGAPFKETEPMEARGRIFIYSGASGALLKEQKGFTAGYMQGSRIAAAGDVDGDGLADYLAGAPGSDGGHVYVLSHKPYLFSTGSEASQSAGGTILFQMDYPDAAGGQFYAVLASNGVGPTELLGTEIPMSDDPLFRNTSNNVYPPFAHNFWGFLDQAGDGVATLSPAPAQLSAAVIGRTFAYCAVSISGAQITHVSVNRFLTILP